MKIVVDGLLTHYEEYGKSNKKVLVIIHGWGRSLNDWIHIAKQLSASHRIILLDLPGFGNTAKPADTYTIYDYANFVLKFATKLGLQNFTLLGHSLGGRIGIILGKESYIAKLILVDSAGVETPSLVYKLQLLLTKVFSKILPKSIKKTLINIIGSDDYINAGEMKQIFKNIVNEDLTPLLSKIKAKTLIIWGNNDDVLNVNTTKLMEKQIPDAMVRIVWGAKHHPHLEKVDSFIEILEEFLNAE